MWFEDLQGTLDQVWAEFARGSVTSGVPANRPTLATTGEDGWAEVRTVVLRASSKVERALEFYSDARSRKVAELTADPRCSLHVWDPRKSLQIRAHGIAALSCGTDLARDRWASVPVHARFAYQLRTEPGAALRGADDAEPLERLDDTHITVVTVTLTEIDALHLARGGHRRSQHVWQDGGWDSAWLVP